MSKKRGLSSSKGDFLSNSRIIAVGLLFVAIFYVLVNFNGLTGYATSDTNNIGSLATTINTCTNITTAGDYVLGNDLISTNNTCISINSSNVNLDCQNKQLNYTGILSKYLLTVSGVNNVTITNCFFNNNKGGVSIANSSLINLSNNGIYNVTSNYGVSVLNSDNLTIYKNNVTKTTYNAIYLIEVNNTDIKSNIFNLTIGLYFRGGLGNPIFNLTIMNNLISNTNNGALFMNDILYADVINNTILNATSVGINIQDSSLFGVNNSNFINNTIVSAQYGFYILKARENVFEGNIINLTLSAIFVDYTSHFNVSNRDNNFTNNFIFNSSFYPGIYVYGGNETLFFNNTITGSVGGVYSVSPENTFDSNVIYNNLGNGISSTETINLNNNLIYGNLGGINITGGANNKIINNTLYHNNDSENYELNFYLTSQLDLNITNNKVYNTTNYFKFVVANSNYSLNLTNQSFCYDETSGCINWSQINVQGDTANPIFVTKNNLLLNADFVSLNSSDVNLSAFNTSANVTLNVSGCTSANSFNYYSLSGLPSSREDIIANGTTFTPSYKSCDSSTRLTFSVSSFSGYAVELIDYNLTTCTTIAASGNYLLMNDITTLSSDDCITINVDNVILNCQNNQLNYTGSAISNVAINVSTTNNNTITNCIINNFPKGIYGDSSTLTIINNTQFTNTNGSGSYDLYFINSDNFTFTNNLIETSKGIYLVKVNNSLIKDNNFYNTTSRGFAARGYSSSPITNLTIKNNNFINSSFKLEDTQSANIINNSFKKESYISMTDNDNYGLINSNFINNTINGSIYDSLSLIRTRNNLFKGNTFSSNGLNYVGINIQSSSYNNNFTNNVITNSSNSAISIGSGSNNNHFTNNTIYNNNEGINFQVAVDGIILDSNNIYNNSNYGVVLNSSLTSYNFTDNLIHDNLGGFFILGGNGTIINNILYNNNLSDKYSFNFYLTSQLDLNITNNKVYNTTNYFKFTVANSNYSLNLINQSFCYDETSGCINWSQINVQGDTANPIFVTKNNLLLNTDFVSLNSSDVNLSAFNTSANITLNVSNCTSVDNFNYYSLSGFPSTREDIIANGTTFTPPYKSCDSLTRLIFSVGSFSGYAVNYSVSVANSSENSSNVSLNSSSTSTSSDSTSLPPGGIKKQIFGKFVKRVWDKIPANEKQIVDVDNGVIGVTELSLTLNKEISAVWIEIRREDSLPEDIPPIKEKTYKYIKISKSLVLKNDDIKEAVISFKVEKDWLNEQGLNREAIVLYHYVNKEWVKLKTSLGDEDENYIHYKSLTPGFSYFLIGEDKDKVNHPLLEEMATNSEKVGLGGTIPKPLTEKTVAKPMNEDVGQVSLIWVLSSLMILSLVGIVIYFLYDRNRKKN